jgi:hypothetical protein
MASGVESPSIESEQDNGSGSSLSDKQAAELIQAGILSQEKLEQQRREFPRELKHLYAQFREELSRREALVESANREETVRRLSEWSGHPVLPEKGRGRENTENTSQEQETIAPPFSTEPSPPESTDHLGANDVEK